jgi:ribosomal protein S18 acetylase RimI-like enzyme
VIHEAYIEYIGLLTPPSGAHNESVESLSAKLAQAEGVIAWLGQEAAGSVLFEPYGDALYLERLAVRPFFRKRGIGAALVNYVEEQTRSRGLRQVTLGVRLQLPQNTAFYTGLGYHIVSYGSHPGYQEYTFMNMSKVLTP